VNIKIKLGLQTSKDIDILRNNYRPAAKRGAILFFVLCDLSGVNPMYQYSLKSYLEVYHNSLKKAELNKNLTLRITNIINTLTKSVYDYGCTGKKK
jgi:dynein heavy chain